MLRRHFACRPLLCPLPGWVGVQELQPAWQQLQTLPAGVSSSQQLAPGYVSREKWWGIAGGRAGLWSRETSPSSLLSLFPSSVCICWPVLLRLMTVLRPQMGQEEHARVLPQLVRAASNPLGERGKTAKSTNEKRTMSDFSAILHPGKMLIGKDFKPYAHRKPMEVSKKLDLSQDVNRRTTSHYQWQ